MIYLKNNPIGIDYQIEKCQNRINDNLSWVNFDVYGRLYLNLRNSMVIAEAYIADGDYREVFVDDSMAKIGFIVKDNRSGSVIQSTEVEVVCSADVTKIYGKTTREDEAALLQVMHIVSQVPGFEVTGARTGNVDKVFNFMDTSKIRYRDMQPFVNFSIQTKVNFFNNICNFK